MNDNGKACSRIHYSTYAPMWSHASMDKDVESEQCTHLPRTPTLPLSVRDARRVQKFLHAEGKDGLGMRCVK